MILLPALSPQTHECLRMSQASASKEELRRLQIEHDKLTQQNMLEQAQHDSECGSLRADLKMKMFEIGRLGMLVEEKSAGNRQMLRENEMLREKLDVLKGEFAKLEVDARLAGVGRKLPEPTALERKKTTVEMTLEIDEQVREPSPRTHFL